MAALPTAGFLVLLLATCVASQGTVLTSFPDSSNRDCTVAASGDRGWCRLLVDCLSVLADEIDFAVNYTLCGVGSRLSPETVVCCPVPVDCGRRKSIITDGREEIGRAVSSWPWMALLGRRKNGTVNWYCDGTLINDRWVLTAAHCLDIGPPDVIRLGEHTKHRDDGDNFHVDFSIRGIVLHPDFRRGGVFTSYHDLALIELSQFVESGEGISPVCLPWAEAAHQILHNETVTITGWGATEFGGKPTDVMRQGHVTVFPSEICDTAYQLLPTYTFRWPQGITEETVLCAGALGGGVDACEGDSGGPLVHEDQATRRFVLRGIVAVGYGCGKEDFPGLYVPVAKQRYLAWIKEVAFSNM